MMNRPNQQSMMSGSGNSSKALEEFGAEFGSGMAQMQGGMNQASGNATNAAQRARNMSQGNSMEEFSAEYAAPSKTSRRRMRMRSGS